MRLGLGTAQWGVSPYGVTNKTGVPTQQQVKHILDLARQKHIRIIHLREDYRLPQRLKQYIREKGFDIVPNDPLKYLSIYEPVDYESTLLPSPKIVQVPLNVFDQRLLKNGFLKTLKKKRIKIHARSVFLQGLLVSDQKRDDPRFKDYFDFIEGEALSKVDAAINFILQVEEVDTVLVGVTSISEFIEVCASWRKFKYKRNKYKIDFSRFASEDLDLIDPRRWTHAMGQQSTSQMGTQPGGTQSVGREKERGEMGQGHSGGKINGEEKSPPEKNGQENTVNI